MPLSENFKAKLLAPIEALFVEAQEVHEKKSSSPDDSRPYVETMNPLSGSDSRAVARKKPQHKRMIDEAALADALLQVDELVGLSGVKRELHRLTAYARIIAARDKQGLPKLDSSMHMVFSGSPGTGKTTMARLVSKILHATGLLSSGHTVEVDKSGLVGGFLGQTPTIVQEKIEEAMGGVLFIDEAYMLTESDDDLYGKEAIATLLTAMENQRDDLVIIVAGYQEKMRKFIMANPGLRSRFTRSINFPDYSPDELQEILIRLCQKAKLSVCPGLLLRSEMTFQELYRRRLTFDGNGRLVRSAFERTIENQAVRMEKIKQPNAEELEAIISSDWDGVEKYLMEIADVEN